MKANSALALALIMGLAACARVNPEVFDQVRGVRVDWTNPQIDGLARALDTCEVWGNDPAIARACAERREEAREVVDGIITCQQSESAAYPACQHVRNWVVSHPPGIAELLRIAGTRGTPADLSNVRNLFRPSNPLIDGAWSNDDRRLAFFGGGWITIGLGCAMLGLGAAVAFRIRSRRLQVDEFSNIAPPPQTPTPAITPLDLDRFIQEDAEHRQAANAEADRIAAAQDAERLAAQSALAAERAAERQRQEDEATALRTAAEDARREFDQIKDLF